MPGQKREVCLREMSRASTPDFASGAKDVDGRGKPGHDELSVERHSGMREAQTGISRFRVRCYASRLTWLRLTALLLLADNLLPKVAVGPCFEMEPAANVCHCVAFI